MPQAYITGLRSALVDFAFIMCFPEMVTHLTCAGSIRGLPSRQIAQKGWWLLVLSASR